METTLAAPLLAVLLVLLGVVVHRGVQARLHLDDAAHQAARAATLERDPQAASAAAERVASTAGVACGSLDVTTTLTPAPDGTVLVTLTCRIDLGEALLLGVPGSRTLTASALEPVDTWRAVGR